MANGSEKDWKSANQRVESDQLSLNRSKSASITRMPIASTSMSLFPPPSPVSILRHGKNSNSTHSSLRRSMNSLSVDLPTAAITKYHSSSVLNGSYNEKRLTPTVQITPVDPKDDHESEISMELFAANNRRAVTIQDMGHSPVAR